MQTIQNIISILLLTNTVDSVQSKRYKESYTVVVLHHLPPPQTFPNVELKFITIFTEFFCKRFL